MEPLADGTVTGVVFEGQGRFTMTIPDRYELAQLRRFAEEGRPDVDRPADHADGPAHVRSRHRSISSPPRPRLRRTRRMPLAAKRHETWLVELLDDADARILAALLNGSAAHDRAT